MTTQLQAAVPPPSPAVPSANPAALGKKALGVLASAMSDRDGEVRAAAAAAWGEIGNPAPAALELLRRALRDRNAHVRVEAAFALHLLGDDSGIPVIERIVRPSTTTAANLSPQEEMHLLARGKSRVHGIKRLSEIGGVQVVEILDKLRSDPSGEVRDATSIALARMDLGEEFSKPFLDAMTDKDETVRAAAVRALAEIGSAQALDALDAAAADPDVAVREEAMRALAKYSSPDTVRLLAQGARDQDKRVAAQALLGLAHIPDGDTSPLLRDVLKSSKAPEVQLKAMAGLLRRGDRPELDLADWALKQKDPDLRVLALDVLEAAAGEPSNSLLGRTMEGDADGKLRVQAASILVRRLSRKAAVQ